MYLQAGWEQRSGSKGQGRGVNDEALWEGEESVSQCGERKRERLGGQGLGRPVCGREKLMIAVLDNRPLLKPLFIPK